MKCLMYCGTFDKKYKNINKGAFNSIVDFLGNDNVIIASAHKSNQFLNSLDMPNANYFNITLADGENWKDAEKKYQKFFKSNKIDELIIFRSTVMGFMRFDNYSLFNSYEEHFKKKDYSYSMNFMTSRGQLIKYAFIKAAVKSGCKLTQFFTDSEEPEYAKYFGLDEFKAGYILNKPKRGYKYAPTYDRWLLTHREPDCDKIYDFVFYASAVTESRDYLIENRDILYSVPKSNVRVVTKDGSKTSSNSTEVYIDQKDYDKLLTQAKFTLAIPAYDHTTFSIWRIFEAMQNNCLCLVSSNCDLTDVKVTFPDVYDIIVKYLVVDFKDIPKKIKQLNKNRTAILDELWNTKSVKNIQNLNWCKKQWNKLLEKGN